MKISMFKHTLGAVAALAALSIPAAAMAQAVDEALKDDRDADAVAEAHREHRRDLVPLHQAQSITIYKRGG